MVATTDYMKMNQNNQKYSFSDFRFPIFIYKLWFLVFTSKFLVNQEGGGKFNSDTLD